MTTLRICALYPDQMNIYADRGNLEFLRRRCEWRGIGFELVRLGAGERLDPAAADLFYIGGGQDRDQAQIAADMLASKRDGLRSAMTDGAVILAVCGGYQLLGHSYELGEQTIEGLGLVDLITVRPAGEPRLIGNIAIEARLAGEEHVLAGFENHGGRTWLGEGIEPLGRVLSGFGNNGRDGFEGVHWQNLFGTYLHGPLLPKNWWLADHLTSLALARSGFEGELPSLKGDLERAAHSDARAVAGA